MDVELELRLPEASEEPELTRAIDAVRPDLRAFIHYEEAGLPFASLVLFLAQQARGENVPSGFVPSTFLFAFVGPRIVGRVSIRHELNEPLRRLGGHIGYFVLPEFRRRGMATAILRQALGIARVRLGISRVLVTCDDDNVGSIRTIEKNGGVLEDVVTAPDLARPKRRYWIGA